MPRHRVPQKALRDRMTEILDVNHRAPPVQLHLISKAQMKNKISTLREPQYNVVYTLQSLGLAEGGVPSIPPMEVPGMSPPDKLLATEEASERASSEQSTTAQKTASHQPGSRNVVSTYDQLKAELPQDSFARVDYAAQLYGLPSEGAVNIVKLFLARQGGYELSPILSRGSCQFAAIRQQLDCPASVWNQHFRRMAINWMVENSSEFEPLIRDQIGGIYGVQEGGRDVAGQHRGPYSYRTYLKYMAGSNSWGDEITLLVISLLFDLKITVIHAAELNHVKIRHNDPTLDTVDLILLYNGTSHYSKIELPTYLVPVRREVTSEDGFSYDDGHNSDDEVVGRWRPRGYGKGKSKVTASSGKVSISDLVLGHDESDASDPEFQPDGSSSNGSDDDGSSDDGPPPELGPGEVAVKKSVLEKIHDYQVDVQNLVREHLPQITLPKGVGLTRVNPRWSIPSKEASVKDCPDCPRKFTSNRAMRRHHRIQHLKTGGHRCPECGKVLSTRVSLRSHQMSHQPVPKSHTCPKCDKSYTTGKALKAHDLLKHPQVPHAEFVCMHCKKGYMNPKTGKAHQNRACVMAPGFKYSICAYCQQKFVRYCDLTKHVKQYHQ